MINTWKDVPQRARRSITIQTEKLIKKYGTQEVWLVMSKLFQQKAEKKRLEDEIKQKEKELGDLKKTNK